MRRSALEIARQAGWDDSVSDIDTRVKIAVLALENAGYIKRGKNVPQVFATSIRVPNMTEADVIRCVNVIREEGILDDSKDLIAYIRRSDTKNKYLAVLNKFTALESFLLSNLEAEEQSIFLKELNEKSLDGGVKFSTVNRIKTIFYYWTIKGYIDKSVDAMASRINITPKIDLEKLKAMRHKCTE